MATTIPTKSIPPQLSNISRDQASQLLEKYRQFKASGTPEDNPEYLRVCGQLNAVKAAKQRQDQLKLYQQHAGLNAQHRSLSQQANPPFPQTSMSNGHSSNVTASDVTSNASAAQKQQMTGASWVSNDMKMMLRNQMKAFQLLSRNVPIPLDVQRAIFTSHRSKGQAQAARETVQQVESDSIEDVPDQKSVPQAIVELAYRGSKTSADPWSYLQESIMYDQHAQRSMRPMVASIMPPGIDIEKAREERESIIYNRIMERRKELEELEANQDSWNTSKSDSPEPEGSLKRRALIEYKMLGLLGKQRALRQQISREMVMADTLAMTANRSMYRRQKKHDIREARFTEKLEREQRSMRENKEKEKQLNWLNQILLHAQEVKSAAEEQRNRMKRFGRLMVSQHQAIEKEEQKRVERTAKQRLQALKANDEETYLRLLGQAKDSRISHLLKQTDNFLSQLSASVKAQQSSAAERWKRDGDQELPSDAEDMDEDDDADEDGNKRVDYYEVAHRIKEEVKHQSSNLVGGTLKEYQLKGLQWMVSLYNNNLNGILADEMGLGKTIQTISLITYLIEKKRQHGPYLVIVPLSTLTNWNNEFEKWAPSVNRIVYKGTPNLRKAAQMQIRQGQFQVLLTTYEYVIKDRPILSKVKWLHMIVDEGHRMKNAQSKLSSTITQYYTTRYRIILTGTPLQNNLPELWALLNFVLPTIFKSVKSFEEWFNTPFANTGGQDKMDLTEEEKILVIRRLHKVLRPFLLRRLKKDVEKDLPEKQERVIKCSFSALQKKLYTQLQQRQQLMLSDGRGGKVAMRGLSNVLMQLRKLCNHPFVYEEVENQMNPNHETNDLIWRTAGKFELLDRILPKFQATGHRVLMFFQMTQIMNIMEDFMRLRGFQYLRLDGSTKSDERSDLLSLYNAPNSPYFMFLLSTRAGGLGLNLQTADTVIIFDSDWNPFQDLQAQDRAHRIGQKNEVRILRLITSNSVEEKILERARRKLEMDGQVIQAGKFDNKSSNEEREAMLRVLLETTEAVEESEDEEMDDDDLNALMMRNDDELDVFQAFDQERARDPRYGNGPTARSRLLPENELPEIYLTDDNPTVDDAIEETFGRGARERTRVKYDDGLTEEQWLEAVDNDEDTIEEAVARKAAKVARRAVNKEKKDRDDDDPRDSPLPSRDNSESPAPRKRGRKPVKRKADEMSIDGEASTPPALASGPPKKRGRQARPTETLSSSEREALQASLDTIYEALDDLEVPFPEAGDENATRPVIDPFIVLPDRKLYADYYNFIKDPICMEMIQKRINEKRYQGLNGFARDMQLLIFNCRTYNEDGSGLYLDAGIIENKTFTLLRSETTAHPELGNAAFDEDALNAGVDGANGADDAHGTVNGNGVSTGNSAAGTPAPTNGGTKLKLNFGMR